MTSLIERLPGLEEPLAMLRACHGRIAKQLDILGRAAVALGEPNQDLVDEAHQAVRGAARYFREAAPRHAQDEEDSLFPRLLAKAPDLGPTLQRLEKDHQKLDGLHQQLDRVALSLDAPDAAQRLGTVIAAMEAVYPEHILIEEEEILPVAERILEPGELAAIGREMAARRQR